MWCTFFKRGSARRSNEGKSTTYCPTVYCRLPWDSPAMSLLGEMRPGVNQTQHQKRAACLTFLLPDSGQAASFSTRCDHIKPHSAASFSDLFRVKAFHRVARGHELITHLLDQSGFTHTCSRNTGHLTDILIYGSSLFSMMESCSYGCDITGKAQIFYQGILWVNWNKYVIMSLHFYDILVWWCTMRFCLWIWLDVWMEKGALAQ